MAIQEAQQIADAHGVKLTRHAENVVRAIEKNNGYCPCVPMQNESTVCPCATFREERKCHCSLFMQTTVNM